MTKPLEIITEVPDENSVKRAVIQFLLYKGYFVLRINSGAAAGEYEDKQGQVKKRFMRFVHWFASGVTFKEGQAGTSDLLAIKKDHPPPCYRDQAHRKYAKRCPAALYGRMGELRRAGHSRL